MFWFWFTLAGKEYICIVRLHEAIEKEAELAKVSVLLQNFCVCLKTLVTLMGLLEDASQKIPFYKLLQVHVVTLNRRCGGFMVSAFDSGLRGTGSSPGR